MDLLIPVLGHLKNDVILGGYPWELMFAHSLRAHTTWRASVESDSAFTAKPKWTYSLVAAFFCHGFGGSFMRDMLTSQPPSLFMNPDLPSAWLLSYMLVNHSPFDLVYKRANMPRSLLSLTLTVYEAVDSCGTIVGSYEKGSTLFPKSPHAGAVAALVGATGGSVFRYLERRYGRGKENLASEFYKPTATLRVACIYVAAYSQLRVSLGVERARLLVMCFHIAWKLLQELVQRQLDFSRILNPVF